MIDARQNGLSAVQQAHADRFLAQLKNADRNRTVSDNSPATLALTPPPAAPTPTPPQPAPTAPAPPVAVLPRPPAPPCAPRPGALPGAQLGGGAT